MVTIKGNLTRFRHRKNQLTSWAPYDGLNRLTTVTFQGGSTLTYGYDAADRLQTLMGVGDVSNYDNLR
jgi:YD repeat-containing protein